MSDTPTPVTPPMAGPPVPVDPLGYYTAPAAHDRVPIGDAARRIAKVLCWVAIGAGLPHVIQVIQTYGGVHQHPDYPWPWRYGGFDGRLRRCGEIFGDFAGPLLVAGGFGCIYRARGGRPALLTGACLFLASSAIQAAYSLWLNFGAPGRTGLSGATVDWKVAYLISYLSPLLLPTVLLGLLTRRAVRAAIVPPPDAPHVEAPADAPEAR